MLRSPLPVASPPPWYQTMTGRFSSSVSGRNTLRYRQSSEEVSETSPLSGWTHSLSNSSASRTSDQGFGGSGGRQRSSSTGGAAYGMPSQERTPSSATPRRAPSSMVTSTPSGGEKTQPVAES